MTAPACADTCPTPCTTTPAVCPTGASDAVDRAGHVLTQKAAERVAIRDGQVLA